MLINTYKIESQNKNLTYILGKQYQYTSIGIALASLSTFFVPTGSIVRLWILAGVAMGALALLSYLVLPGDRVPCAQKNNISPLNFRGDLSQAMGGIKKSGYIRTLLAIILLSTVFQVMINYGQVFIKAAVAPKTSGFFVVSFTLSLAISSMDGKVISRGKNRTFLFFCMLLLLLKSLLGIYLYLPNRSFFILAPLLLYYFSHSGTAIILNSRLNEVAEDRIRATQILL